MTRDEAIDLILSLEGGLSTDPYDPGGTTKYGISQRSYPSLNIHDLTRDQAKDIYAKDYWQPVAAAVAEDAPRLATLVFDTAVNMGPRAAVELLQNTVSVTADGIIGPITRAALESNLVARGEDDLIMRYAADRAVRYSRMTQWDRYGRGWMRRLMTVVLRIAAPSVELHEVPVGLVRATVLKALDLLEAHA